MSNKKQTDHIADSGKMVTSVDWLAEQLQVCASSNFDYAVPHTEILIPTQVFESLFKQAKAIHKEEIIDDELKFVKKQLENIEHYRLGYNAAQNNLYTEKQVTQAMLEMCEYIISAFERRYLIDTEEKAKEIIISLKKNNL